MTIDPRQLRDAFGAFLTGVTVVTTHNAEGRPIGFTANSFTSVSLEPPLLLVCLAKTSRNFEAMTTGGRFAVNVLSEEQKDVSNIFARPVEDRFATVAWAPGPHGSPVISGVAAWFDCGLHQVVDAGDHVILLGRIEAFGNAGTAGLGYARGSYFSPTLADKALLAGQDLPQVVGAVAERDGLVLLKTEEDGSLALPVVHLKPGEGVEVLERMLEAMTGASARTGMLYSVYEDTAAKCQHVIYRASLGAGEGTAANLYPFGDLPLDRVKDAATRDVLRRYAAERMIGNFGLYVGNQERGRVHALAGRGNA